MPWAQEGLKSRGRLCTACAGEERNPRDPKRVHALTAPGPLSCAKRRKGRTRTDSDSTLSRGQRHARTGCVRDVRPPQAGRAERLSGLSQAHGTRT